MDVDAFVAASDAYPIPTSPDGAPIHFSYGTAGFRTIGDVLASTVFRCGAVAAIRSSVTGRATGMVVTASHNPERDNGVKLVDCDGGMLPVAWERHAEAIANAPTHDALRAAIELAQTPAEAHLPQHNHPPPHAPTPPPPHVFLARDTRPTGPTLAAAAKAGAEAIGAQVTDCGLMTTPQLHYVVYASYRNLPCDESDYFARLARGFGNMVQGVAGGTHDASTIVVDCANGVGAAKLAPLRTALGADCVLTLDPRNYKYGRPGSLNNEVGADFVQKEKTCPVHGGFDGVGADARCVSVDGDADRLVYFRKINTARTGESDESNRTTLKSSSSTAIRSRR
jgi:phosphoacetylglucosamine mutase